MHDVTKDLIPNIISNLEVNMTIDTQLQAYNEIQDRATYLRNRVLGMLKKEIDGLTSEELSILMREPYESVQPRTSELHQDLRIFDSGLRRENKSGKKAIVWQLVIEDEDKQKAIEQTLKKMKPIGDPKLFGEMMRCIYACAAFQNYENELYAENTTMEWMLGMVKNVRKSKFSGADATE